MPILIGAKGATIGGVNYPAYTYVDWLTPTQEALAVQGGDATMVAARGLTRAQSDAVAAAYAAGGDSFSNGRDLRRAARKAAFNASPIIVAPVWAATTAYIVGDVRRIPTGEHICCTVAGISGATAPVPSITVLDGRPVVDGTATWYFNGFRKTASDIDAPTVSFAASAAAAGLTQFLFTDGSGGPTFLRCVGRGAILMSANGAHIGQFNSAIGNSAASGNSTGYGTGAGYSAANVYSSDYVTVEAVVVDHKFAVATHNSANACIIEIDGKVVEGNPTVPSSASGAQIIFDFNGVIKRRVVRIIRHGTVLPNIMGISLTAAGYFETPDANNDTLLWLGDSFSNSVLPGQVAFGGPTPYWLERALGLQAVAPCGVSGGGYVSKNTNLYNVPDVLANAANQQIFALYAPKHILFASGFNDRVVARATVLAAALASWQTARAQYPSAKITVLDGWSGSSGPDANAISQAADLRTQFNAWNDPNSRFVAVVSSAAATAWIQGTGNAGAAITAGNSSSMTSTDGVHPSPAGARYLAARLGAAIDAAWGGGY